MCTRTTHANALINAGRGVEAETRFDEAEAMQAKDEPQLSLLYSLRGFQYCDLLLTGVERAAWRRLLVGPEWMTAHVEPDPAQAPRGGGMRDPIRDGTSDDSERLIIVCESVSGRATETLAWIVGATNAPLLDVGNDHLTLTRAGLYSAILRGEQPSRPHLEDAVDYLRRAGQQDYFSPALPTRALWRASSGDFDGAREDLDEAFEIAERGPMRLHLADIHLHRARLFGLMANRPAAYPWVSPRDDLEKARRLIEDCGYGRRREELEDAESAWRRLYANSAPHAAT